MTHLTFIRYFVPDSNEFTPGWYQTRNEGRTRIGDVPLSLSDALYDGPNRVIIDDNTPETNSLPVSGGKGVDEFLITRTANSVVIDDDSGANVIVFERDVVITSIERQAGSEGASVAQYVITLSSGKTITLRNPASFTFQHLGDATRTDPISAEDFITAYEDGFAASDTSHPDIIGDASGPSGVQGPMITSTATGAVYEGDLSTSGDLDVNDDTLLASTTPFTISTQGTYGTASIDDDGEWVYKLDNGNADVRALNSGDTLTDTFVVNVTADDDSAETQTITITISGRTDVFGTNGEDSSLGDASTSDNQAIFGFNSSDTLTGGSGDDLLVGGYGTDDIDLSAGGTDTVVYRINSSGTDGKVKAEDGRDEVYEFTPGEDKLVILDVNGSPTTLAGLFDSLTKDHFQLRRLGDDDGDRNLSSSELDDGARVFIEIVFDAGGTVDGGPTSGFAGLQLVIFFDRVTSEALNDRAVWDTLTGGTNFFSYTISTVAMLSSLFGGFGRPGYDAALDNGGFISIIGPDDLPDSYFFPVLNVDTSGSDIVSAVYEGDPSTSGDLDVNDDTLLASTTPFTISTQGTYGTASIGDDGEWVYKLDNGNADVRALNSGDTLTDTFVVDVNLASGRAETQTITITISGRTDVFGTNGEDSSLGDASTSDNQAIFGFNSSDTLTGGSGDDLLVGGYGTDDIDLSAGGTDTVVYRINSSDGEGFVKAEDGTEVVREFTPGEDKLVILDVNGSPTTLAGLFDSLTGTFRLRRHGDDDSDANLSSSELDAGARAFIDIVFQSGGTVDGGPTSSEAGRHLRIYFDRVTSEALNDRAVWDTLTGGTNFSSDTISTVAQLSSLFGGFGRPGYDMALDDGGFISIIGPDDLPDSYFFPVLNVDTSGSDIVSAVYEGDPSTSGDLDINDDTLLASTTPFTISTQGTYGTASIGDDGEWVYKLDNGNADVRALNSGDTLTDTFVVDVNLASGRAETQTITITISGRTDVFGTNGEDSSLGDASTSDNQAIFGFNSSDTLTGGSGDDLLVGGYGTDDIDLSAGGTDTVVYRINSSGTDGKVKAEDGRDEVYEFTPGEDKLVILDVNGSPTTLAGLFDSLTKDHFQLRRLGDDDGDRNLSSSELDDGARVFIEIVFDAGGTVDGGPTSGFAGLQLVIFFDRVTSEALNDRAVWDTLTGGTNFFSYTISTVAMLSSLFGGFGRPGYDAALDNGGFISIIGPDDLPDSYFEIVPISGDETGSVTEGGAPGDDNTGTLTAPGHTITLVSKETTDSPGTSTGTYGVMRFNVSSGEWVYTLDDRAEALADQQTETESFIFSAGGATFEVTITISGVNDAPEIGIGIEEQAGQENHRVTINLGDLFTDPDEGDELTLTFAVTLADGSTGDLAAIGLSYSETTDPDGNLIREITGEPTVLGVHTIEVTGSDGSGSVSASFTVNIVADNAPVITSDPAAAVVVEDDDTPSTGILTIEDDDEGDALPTIVLDGADSVTGVRTGDYGKLAFDAATGEWTYRLDNTLADVQALGVGDTLIDTFTFSAEGAENYELTIKINGANESPEAGPPLDPINGTMGQAIQAINLSDLFTDADGDVLDLTLALTVTLDGVAVDLEDDGTTITLGDSGLTYNIETHILSGIPSAVGTYKISVVATDTDGGVSEASEFDIVVVAQTITSTGPDTGTVEDETETPAEDSTIDQSSETTPQKIEAGDGSDIITGGQKDDQIDGGAGDDEIKLTRTVNNVEEDAGADEVLYTFGYDGVGIDGGDEIVGFKRGQDKLTFIVDRNFNSLTEFLQSLNGADDADLTADDAFIVTMQWGLDTDGAFYFDSVLLHFKEGTSFGGGRIFSPVVTVTFDERLGLDDLIEILGGAENVANNFDGGLAAFKNLDEVLPRLFGEGSIGFKGVDPSGTNGASERASEEPQPPIYETLSEQHGDDLQPTSFELGGGEPDII